MTAPLPASHLLDHALGHVRDALAADERVGELGLDVDIESWTAGTGGSSPDGSSSEVAGDVVVVRGVVSTTHRKAGVTVVVTEVLAAHGCLRPVRDDTIVVAATAPTDDAESL